MARAAGSRRVGKSGFMSRKSAVKKFGRQTAKKYFG